MKTISPKNYINLCILGLAGVVTLGLGLAVHRETCKKQPVYIVDIGECFDDLCYVTFHNGSRGQALHPKINERLEQCMGVAQ